MARKIKKAKKKSRRLDPRVAAPVLQDAGINVDPPEYVSGSGLPADAPGAVLAAPGADKPNAPGLEYILAGRPYLPTDPAERKSYPIVTGFLDYFPLACLEVSHVSVIGNQQHNPGQPLHWARGKSMDQADTAVRHIMERGGLDSDNVYHMAKAIWRMMADFEIFLEEKRGLPPSRASWSNG